MNKEHGPQQTGELPNLNVEGASLEEVTATMASKAEERALAKKKEKEDKKAKEFWNGMISRRDSYNMVQETYKHIMGEQQQTQQQLQFLMIQNRTLLEILAEKGIATEAEINEHSKKVMESIFGPMPEDLHGEATGDVDATADKG